MNGDDDLGMLGIATRRIDSVSSRNARSSSVDEASRNGRSFSAASRGNALGAAPTTIRNVRTQSIRVTPAVPSTSASTNAVAVPRIRPSSPSERLSAVASLSTISLSASSRPPRRSPNETASVTRSLAWSNEGGSDVE